MTRSAEGSPTHRPGDTPPAARRANVLVVGGGITGCGVAHDLTLRGLKVGLVEKGDWAAATSSASSNRSSASPRSSCSLRRLATCTVPRTVNWLWGPRASWHTSRASVR